MGKKVMVAGHLCLDITPRFAAGAKVDIGRVFSPGQLTNVGQAVLSAGGAVSNTGLAMAKLGLDVMLNGKVGEDAFGNIIRQFVGAERAAGLKAVPDQNSSYTIVLAPPGVDRFFLHYPATNDTFGADDVDYELAKQCVLFHFGYPPLMKNMYENDGAELVKMYKRIKQLGVTTSLDMTMPDLSSSSGRVSWKSILERVAPYVDVFLPSIEEIAFMMDRELFEKRKSQAAGEDATLAYEPGDFGDISDALLSMGIKIVAVKCGIRGVYLHTAGADQICAMGTACPGDVYVWSDRQIWAGSFKTEKFGSALGAGDAAVAGFLCGLVRGFSPEDTMQIANALGWQNVQAVDALSGISGWQSTLELLEAKDRARNPVGLSPDDWRYSPDRQVYYGPKDTK